MSKQDRRKDPEDGSLYTLTELLSFYKGKHSKKAIEAYWNETCTPARKTKANAKEQSKKTGEAKWVKSKPENPWANLTASGLCVAGEALIDFLPTTTGEGDSAYRGKPGGSPFNCCIAAHRLGVPTTYLGALSKDLFGEELYGLLRDEGVNMDLVNRVDAPTTLAFVCRQQGGGEKYAFFKENAADRSLTKAYVSKVMKDRRFSGVHMSLGAVTLEQTSCAQAFQQLYRAGGQMGALRSFDPNIRANMINEGGKAYSKKLEGMLKLVDVVKTSDEDVEFLYQDTPMDTVVLKWMKLGSKLVVITKGAKGADAYVPQRGDSGELKTAVVSAAAPTVSPNTIDDKGKSVPVADTVGAGDTFMGALLLGFLKTKDGCDAPLLDQLLRNKPWDDAAIADLQGVMRRAAVSAAITCSRRGANPPTAAEVDTVMSVLKFDC